MIQGKFDWRKRFFDLCKIIPVHDHRCPFSDFFFEGRGWLYTGYTITTTNTITKTIIVNTITITITITVAIITCPSPFSIFLLTLCTRTTDLLSTEWRKKKVYKGYKRMLRVADILQIAQRRIQGRSPGGRPPPPSQGLDDRASPYLKVWIPHCSNCHTLSCLHFGCSCCFGEKFGYFFLAKCTRFSVIFVSST